MAVALADLTTIQQLAVTDIASRLSTTGRGEDAELSVDQDKLKGDSDNE